MHTETFLADLDAPRQKAMLDLASSCCPRFDVRGYLLPRFSRYHYAVVSEAGGQLLAFELVQEFEEAGERHVYLGPLFSRRVACVPMFVDFFQRIHQASPERFHLLAEIQNPRIALVLKRLFLRTSFPELDSLVLPPHVRRVVERFCARLPHVGPVDFPSLRGRATETLFRHSSSYDPVVRWMRRRGVNLHAGDSQLFVVSCDGSTAGRDTIVMDLRRGAHALANWPACKRDMLGWFESGIGGEGV
jgi:hypothetical protein